MSDPRDPRDPPNPRCTSLTSDRILYCTGLRFEYRSHVFAALRDSLVGNPVAYAILVYSLAAVIGLAIATIKIRGIGIGVTGVLFAAILLASLNLTVDHSVIEFVRDFGLVIFVFTIGLQLGPGFFASLRSDGLRMNLIAVGIVLLGAAATVATGRMFGVAPAASVGIFSGATTNTPSLGAAQETLVASGIVEVVPDVVSLSYAITYPIGIFGIIVTLLLLRRVFRIDTAADAREFEALNSAQPPPPIKRTLLVENPNVNGLAVSSIPSLQESGVVISRIRRAGTNDVNTAVGSTEIGVGDVLLAVGSEEGLEELRVVVGSYSDVDLFRAEGPVSARPVVVTRNQVVGKSLASLGLSTKYGVVVTRVIRGDIEMVASSARVLKYGDMLQIVGDEDALDAASEALGNAVKDLQSTNFLPVFVGIAAGVIAGVFPVAVPGLAAPLRLGIAGGALILAIILGRVGKVGPFVFYLPDSVSMALKEFGMLLFLASIGLKSGQGFFQAFFSKTGALWIASAFLIAVVPLVIFGVVCRLGLKLKFVQLSGLLAGSMTDPPALAFAGNITRSDAPAVSYATVYPLTMLLRIIVAQALAIGLMS